MQPPAGQSPGLLPVHVGTPRTSYSVQTYRIYDSNILDGYVADGRFSLIRFLKPVAHETLQSEHRCESRRRLVLSLTLSSDELRTLYAVFREVNDSCVDRSSEAIYNIRC